MADKKPNTFDETDAAALAEMGATAAPDIQVAYTPKQERIIAGFEEVQRFVREHGRLPQHGEDRDIFERLYAVRLARITQNVECLELLGPLDSDGLLDPPPPSELTLTDEAALAALGPGPSDDDITAIRHVRPPGECKRPDEVAQRRRCPDFDVFAERFAAVQHELSLGVRKTKPFKGQDDQAIATDDWFILDGQKVLVASASEPFKQDYGETDRRLRVIYDNGQESDLLLRSLRRALNKDEISRRILEADAGPLFSGTADADDTAVGHIYVLRSLSENPFVAEHRRLIHKIVVTRGSVAKRLAHASKDPTYLHAGVEVVAEYALSNVDPAKVEKLLHRFFHEARIDLRLKDRFGVDVEPREWFLAPLETIDEAVRLLIQGGLAGAKYDLSQARIVGSGEQLTINRER